MFIKMGQEHHLNNLMRKGEMFFNPCKYFRELEDQQKKKGIGDGNDGGLISPIQNAYAINQNGTRLELHGGAISIIMDPAVNTPIYCLRRTDDEYITPDYREKLRDQFPAHTHALIIRNESDFLENVRYNLKSRAFAHSIFYQDALYIEFLQFLSSGTSDINFYTQKPKKGYFMELRWQKIDSNTVERLFIDHSNYYKTMYRKSTYFSDQMEYRIVLPYEHIDAGMAFSISPFSAELISIDDLVKEGK